MKSYLEFIRALFHVGPISTIVLIKTITLSVIYCSLMWWPPNESICGLLSLTSFLVASGLVMFNFFSAISHGPGYLPLGWEPKDESAKSKLQYCVVCKGYKAPRAHHCRKCGRCVMKLDHHCPWINSCVGHENHSHFVFFLVSAIMGCSQATVILACSLYRALYRGYYMFHGFDGIPVVYLGLYGFIWCLFSCGCAVGVVLGVGFLLYYQMKVILRNETTIEEWILEKAHLRRRHNPQLGDFKNPYDLGWKNNFNFVVNLACLPIGDGVNWPVAEGCDQYSLTVEQLAQKSDKRRRMREYEIIEKFSGSWFPVTKGFGTFYHPPCSDESRIPLQKGDRVLVTRWKKYWLYGEKFEGSVLMTPNEIPKEERPKGWFPRRCALEVANSACNDNLESDQEVEQSEEIPECTVNAFSDSKKDQ
ncbi:unnamed protein product [Orchesella dallaii]|uniref:Palmitoyltransferase n=1 Tax=Orchesella dallaii TaxID=48710 RepID=A0ABP1QEF4_9HEXA